MTVFGKSHDYYNYSTGRFDLRQFEVEKIINSDLVVIKDNFVGIVEDVLKQYNVTTDVNDVKSITFYGKDINLNVDSKITGFSLIRYTEKGFYQEMYKIKNGIASLDAEFTREYHTAIFIKSFSYFAHRVADENNSTLIIFNSQRSSKFNTKSGDDEFAMELALLEQFPVIDLNKVYDQGCTVSSCDVDNEDGYCSSAGSEDVVCHRQPQRGRPCPKDETENPINEGTEPEDEHIEQMGRVAMYSKR